MTVRGLSGSIRCRMPEPVSLRPDAPFRPAPVLRPVPAPRARASRPLALGALAELVASPGAEVAERARAALTPLLAHDALVLVTPDSSGFPVQIAAARSLRNGLTAIEWSRVVEGAATAPGTVARLQLPQLDSGLQLTGWVAATGGLTVSLIVAAHGPARDRCHGGARGDHRGHARGGARAPRRQRSPARHARVLARAEPGTRARASRAPRPSFRVAVRLAPDAAQRRVGRRLTRRAARGQRGDRPRVACAARPRCGD